MSTFRIIKNNHTEKYHIEILVNEKFLWWRCEIWKFYGYQNFERLEFNTIEDAEKHIAIFNKPIFEVVKTITTR